MSEDKDSENVSALVSEARLNIQKHRAEKAEKELAEAIGDRFPLGHTNRPECAECHTPMNGHAFCFACGWKSPKYAGPDKFSSETKTLRADVYRLESELAEAEQCILATRQLSVEAFAPIRAILGLDDKENLQGACARIMGELADARATIALCAQNTAAADLAQEVEFLKAEVERLEGENAQFEVDRLAAHKECDAALAELAALRATAPAEAAPLLEDVAAMIEQARILSLEVTPCDHCGNEATCHGTYEGQTAFACDDCCGHGCEDGHCIPMYEYRRKISGACADALARMSAQLVAAEAKPVEGEVTKLIEGAKWAANLCCEHESAAISFTRVAALSSWIDKLSDALAREHTARVAAEGELAKLGPVERGVVLVNENASASWLVRRVLHPTPAEKS